MSLHEVNAATDIDQQTKGEPSIHEWKAISLSQEEIGLSNGSRSTANMLGDQTWSKKMKMKCMDSPLEKENSLRGVEHTEQQH